MMADNSLPGPLVPPGVDLRGFRFMPLDVVRLRDSGLVSIADAEAFRTCVLSWCVAWHQLPAGSLPNDDATLARMLGWGRDLRGWRKVRAAGGLRGWILCSDGRLYHPVVAEKVIEAWGLKQAQLARTEAARRAREEGRQRASQTLSQNSSQHLSQSPESSVTENVTASNRQDRTGIDRTEEESSSLPLGDQEPTSPKRPTAKAKPRPEEGDLAADFAEFWRQFPRKVDRPRAVKAYTAARRKGVPASEILAGAMRYAQARDGQDPQYTRHPATWINGQGWNDEPSPQPRAPHTTRRDDTNEAIALALSFGQRGETDGIDHEN
jgi:hypothetical protein